MSRKKELIIKDAINNQEPITVFFVGSFPSGHSGRTCKVTRASVYRNHGVFRFAGPGRVQTGDMPFSRHISKINCIMDKRGQLLFGQYCPSCKTSVPAKYCNCDLCKGQLRRVPID